MKLLNRKGFTLIELLAVIIILGIVMVLTIPSVIDSMNNAKYKQLQNAANKVADFILEQYTIEQMDPNSLNSSYSNYLKGKIPNSTDGSSSYFIEAPVLESAGISNASTNITRYCTSTNKFSVVFYNTDKNKMCVRLQAKKNGEFFNASDDKKNYAFSSGCPALKDKNGNETTFSTTWNKYITVTC